MKKYIGYVSRVFAPKVTVKDGQKRTHRNLYLLTNEGEKLVVVYNGSLIKRLDALKPGTAIVVFPSGERDGTLFVGYSGRIIIASEEHKKDLKPYEELKKNVTFYRFNTVNDMLSGQEGFYTIYGDLYNVSKVYPVEKKDKKSIVLRIALEDYTGSVWSTLFDPAPLMGLAGVTEDEIFSEYKKMLEGVSASDEDAFKEQKRKAQTELASMFSNILGRSFIFTVRKRKREETGDYEYAVVRIEIPTPEAIKALSKEVVA